MDRIDRIREMEERMDRVARWTASLSAAIEEHPTVQADVNKLSSYYGSGLWREDYETDEAGELPEDLKRGILRGSGDRIIVKPHPGNRPGRGWFLIG